MKKERKKFLLAALAVSALLCCLPFCAACSGKQEQEQDHLEEETLTVWTMTGNGNDLNTLPGVLEMERRTGIKVQYQSIDSAEAATKFSLLLAKGELPDIVYLSLTGGYPGGMEQAIEDGIFLDPTELIAGYMPHYREMLENNEEIRKGIQTESGKQLPYSISGDDNGPAAEGEWLGLFLRGDWLEKVELALPETLDDWHTVLTCFRDFCGAESPLLLKKNGTFTGGAFVTAFGIQPGFYLEGDTVKYGPSEPGYRDYLELMADWYQEGLIDANFMTNGFGLSAPAELLLNGVIGAGEISWTYTEDYFDGVYLTAVKNPVQTIGDIPYGEKLEDGIVNSLIGISATCKKPELAATWLDYQYSREGMELNFYGIEGESFERLSDGSYALTNAILEAPEGAEEALKRYARGNGIGWYNWKVLEKFSLHREHVASSKQIWSEQDYSRCLPHTIDFEGSSDDTSYRIVNALSALVTEKTVAYITGREGFETYDSFQRLLREYGLEQAIRWYQEQYDRYQSR